MKPLLSAVLLVVFSFSCKESNKLQAQEHENNKMEPRFMTLAPGHFHAALVYKNSYEGVSPYFDVFAPEGPELNDFLTKVNTYNTRTESPTNWVIEKHISENYLDNMLAEKPGNVLVVAGKNARKIDYIQEAVKAGIHVYADKPMVINPKGYEVLKSVFKIAEKQDVLVYDIMTERFEITTIMQKILSQVPYLFGELEKGSPSEPAISKESVHHFSKVVSGQPLVRPPWFFDIRQEGDGLVDVTTHLVDLVQWEAFPGEIIDTTAIEMISAKRWATVLTKQQFEEVTGKKEFTNDILQDVVDGKLHVACNGEMVYTINGSHAKVSVKWDYVAPKGTGDTHFSIMRGKGSDLIIKQGADEGYKPALYIRRKLAGISEANLKKALMEYVEPHYPGISFSRVSDGYWKLNIPEVYQVGHEAHFGQVTENFLKYYAQGKLPSWEVPNMLAKYYTIMQAYKMAGEEID